jgi:hypothetical protein
MTGKFKEYRIISSIPLKTGTGINFISPFQMSSPVNMFTEVRLLMVKGEFYGGCSR